MAVDYKSVVKNQNSIIDRMREDALSKGVVGYLVKVDDTNTTLIVGEEMPLRPKYVDVSTPKFGGKKRKNSNSGGTGRAGRRAKRPRVPSNIR